MKDLQKRIEECLARLKELPALIRAEREKMNGKAAIEELKTRLKGLYLDFIAEAEILTDIESGKKRYTNAQAREHYALEFSNRDEGYQQVAGEIKRFEYQRNTASMNHESFVKEHSGLISTVDVLREMLVVAHYHDMVKIDSQAEIDRLGVSVEAAKLQVETAEAQQREIITIHNMNMKEQEASNVEG